MSQNGGMLAGDNNPVISGITEVRGPLQQAYQPLSGMILQV